MPVIANVSANTRSPTQLSAGRMHNSTPKIQLEEHSGPSETPFPNNEGKRMNHARWRRPLALLATFTLTAGAGLVVDGHSHSAAAVTDLDASRLLHLTFDESDDSAVDGESISDASGKGFDAVVRGDGATIETRSAERREGKECRDEGLRDGGVGHHDVAVL